MTHGNRREGQSHELYQQIRNNLSEEFSVLAIDFYGFGESSIEGLRQANYSLDRRDDIETAVEYLKGNFGVSEDQIVLVGHSMGATEVMRAALDLNYRLAIPIGLGDWDSLLADPKQVIQYTQKILRNTGVRIEPERVYEDGKLFTANALFLGCPETPVWLVFASRDDGREPLSPSYHEAHNRCGQDLQWSVIPFSNHMYGTEGSRFPKILTSIVPRINLSFLMMRLNNILENA
jgi:pimeloyl-ACP methyl ester carboxylesterase